MKKTIAVGFLFLSLLFVTTICLGQSYTITDLGTSPGGVYSVGTAINASGQVTGYSDTGGSIYHAFLYSPATGMVGLGTLPGGVYSQGLGINSAGQVTGFSTTAAGIGIEHAFLYSPGTGMVDLGILPSGGNFSQGLGINDAGQVTGWSAPRAFLYSPATGMVDLGILPGNNESAGTAINASGQVTGYSDTQGGVEIISHTFLYSPATGMVDLGTPPGDTYSQGLGINASGQVTGYAKPSSSSAISHAFLYNPGTGMTDLGAFTVDGSSFGFGINDAGQVVGMVGPTKTGPFRAFLYRPSTGMIDLNTVLPSGSGWTLNGAFAINNSGQITGFGINSQGQQHAFLLTPSACDTPVADAGPDRTVRSGEFVSFDFTNSQCSSGTAGVHWDFGDGQAASGPHVHHRFSEPGVYQVVLTVTNSMGRSATDTAQIKVEPVTVTISFSSVDNFGFSHSASATAFYVWVSDVANGSLYAVRRVRYEASGVQYAQVYLLSSAGDLFPLPSKLGGCIANGAIETRVVTGTSASWVPAADVFPGSALAMRAFFIPSSFGVDTGSGGPRPPIPEYKCASGILTP
jgi:probable HAF family extracellular repeat protein